MQKVKDNANKNLTTVLNLHKANETTWKMEFELN